MTNSSADALVVQTVRTVRDRFGVEGLRHLLELASRELQDAERAASVSHPRPADTAANLGDTQEFIAFTGDER